MSNTAASVRARLLNKAKADRLDFSLVLIRYGLERLLYRLSISPSQDHFVLKGALLFDMWFSTPHRPTRDMDLLGFGLAEKPVVHQTFQGICAMACDDGMAFDLTCGCCCPHRRLTRCCSKQPSRPP